MLSIALLGAAGVLIDTHLRDWRRALESLAGQPTTPAVESARRFASSRRFRRLIASGAIGMVGLLIGLWPLMPQQPWWVACYAATLATLAGLIFVLGLADAVANGRYYRAERRRLREAERVALTEALTSAAKKKNHD